MADFLPRLAKTCLPVSALLSLMVGPSAAAAGAGYEYRAWLAEESARQAAETNRPKADASSSPHRNDDAKSGGKDRGSERTFSSFFAPASSKPSDSSSNGGAPVGCLFQTAIHLRSANGKIVLAAQCTGEAATSHRRAHLPQGPPLV
ncbi:MAG TPA: hypothetical protein VNT79_03685 [Phycisphaerae bacterium]|nr:hypothetical protein [Phycisphaerae bacterium]